MFYRDLKPREARPSGFRPDKTRAVSFLNGFKNTPGKACVNRVHNNYAFVNVGNYSIREKYHILMRGVLSADKTPHTYKEEVYRYKVTARDVLSTI